MSLPLNGRVAVVTGAANGIGAATAIHLATEGARVVVADLDLAGAQQLAEVICTDGGTAVAERVDIADEASVLALAASVKTRCGRLDILHNNAAATGHDIVGADTDVLNIDLAIWDISFNVNLRGTLLVTRALLPLLIASGGGSIINMSSMEGLSPTPGMRIAYSTSKAAICMLSSQIAAAYGKQGIRCNTIAPGIILTATLKSAVPDELREKLLGQILTPSLGEPIDIARMVAYLGSDAGRYITGQTLQIDGGILSHAPIFSN